MSRLRQNLSQRQTQSLLLKPKMLQSLEMLAMPLMQLETHLKQEMVTNPMLELQENRDEEEDEFKNSDETEKTEAEKAEAEKALTEKTEAEKAEEEEFNRTLEETKELSEVLDSFNEYYGDMASKNTSGDKMNFEQIVRNKDDKRVEFMSQLDYLDITEDEYDFTFDLIDSANEYGFLPVDFSVYGLAEEYGVSEDRADELHQEVLHFDPKGITARNIKECLLAQLDDTSETKVIRELIRDDFDDLIHKRYKKLSTDRGVTINTILAWKDIISKLDPKPGMRILSNTSAYIVPDVIVKRIDKEYEIIVNDFSFMKIRMSRRYKKILLSVKKDRAAVEYVRNKINSAKFLIKSVYLRGRTLERVTKSIIRNQPGFFYENSGVLNPLTYAVIADELQVSESTISRVVRQKYADTPFGVMCLKDFFTSKAGIDENYNSVSRQNVETLMKKLIENEDDKKPLSDQDIADKLKGDGISVSRRVVAKYRKAKGILNSHLRRVL